MTSLTRALSSARKHEYLRLALFSALAASAAFLVGVIAPNVSSVVAAITALLVTRGTFHESIQEGGRQIVGSIAGAILGAGLLTLFGFNIFVLISSIAAAYLIARLLRLGEEGALTISVTTILVLGLHLGGDEVESRLLGVFAGSLVALVVALLVPYENPQETALKKAVAYSDRLSWVLAQISGALRRKGLGEHIPRELPEEWLAEAESVQNGLDELSREVEALVAGARWSPLIQRSRAEQTLRQCKVGTDLSMTIVGICRELLMTDGGQPLTDTVALHLSDMYGAAADAVRAQAHVAQSKPAAVIHPGSAPVQNLETAHHAARGAVKKLDETGALILGGSLTQNGETIMDIVSSTIEK